MRVSHDDRKNTTAAACMDVKYIPVLTSIFKENRNQQIKICTVMNFLDVMVFVHTIYIHCMIVREIYED